MVLTGDTRTPIDGVALLSTPSCLADQMFRVSGQFENDTLILEPCWISHSAADGQVQKVKTSEDVNALP